MATKPKGSWWADGAHFYENAHTLAKVVDDQTVYLGPEQRVSVTRCPPSWLCEAREEPITPFWPHKPKR